MQSILLVPPASEPVSLAELQAHLRVERDLEDALLLAYAQAAREMVEAATGRALLPQTWQLRLDAFAEPIMPPHAPVTAVTAIEYVTASGALTLPPADYSVVLPAGPAEGRARILPARGRAWPGTDGNPDAVRITYVAGYASAAAVPAALRAAILLAVGDLYANREQASDRPITDNPAFARLIHPYRLWWN